MNITLSIFGALLILSLFYIKIFGKNLKQKSEIAYHERGVKSKIIHQILNAIIEVKIYKKEIFILKQFIKSIKKGLSLISILDLKEKFFSFFINK